MKQNNDQFSRTPYKCASYSWKIHVGVCDFFRAFGVVLQELYSIGRLCNFHTNEFARVRMLDFTRTYVPNRIEPALVSCIVLRAAACIVDVLNILEKIPYRTYIQKSSRIAELGLRESL